MIYLKLLQFIVNHRVIKMYAVQCNSYSRYLPGLLIIIRAIHHDSTATIATHSLIDIANCYFEIFIL